MFCVSSPNCKIFAQVVHTLAKIGDDVLFEPRANSLVLKTKNMAESSYAEIEFHSNFFSTFSFNPALYQEDTINFKVTMRSLVSVVKSPHSFDKNVDTCLLRYDAGKFQLMVSISYSKGTMKEYIIPHIEYESFEANFSKADAKNYIVSDACTLMSATNQFKAGEDEITLSSGKESSILENHLQNAKDCKTTVKTTVRVDHQYLETYLINFPTQITFCLKEFKALLTLSENVRLPVAFYFDTPGKPLILEVSEQGIFRINVLISTLQALPNDQQQASQSAPASMTTQSNHQNHDDDQPPSVQIVNRMRNAACSETSPLLNLNQSKVNQNVAQNKGNELSKQNNNFQAPSLSIPNSSQDASQSNVQIRSQYNRYSTNKNECNESQNEYRSLNNNEVQINENNSSQNECNGSQNHECSRSQNNQPGRNQSNENSRSQNNECNRSQSNEYSRSVNNGYCRSQSKEDSRSQNNEYRRSHSNELDGSQNTNNLVNSCHDGNREPNVAGPCLQKTVHNNLDGLDPNDLVLDENDFVNDVFQINAESVSLEAQPEPASSRPVRQPCSKRRKHSDENNTLEDIEAFIMDKRCSINAEAQHSNHNGLEKSGALGVGNPVHQSYSVIFKRYFNSGKNRKWNRPKILVYDTDGASDSD